MNWRRKKAAAKARISTLHDQSTMNKVCAVYKELLDELDIDSKWLDKVQETSVEDRG